jgi:hypothetical protein
MPVRPLLDCMACTWVDHPPLARFDLGSYWAPSLAGWCRRCDAPIGTWHSQPATAGPRGRRRPETRSAGMPPALPRQRRCRQPARWSLAPLRYQSFGHCSRSLALLGDRSSHQPCRTCRLMPATTVDCPIRGSRTAQSDRTCAAPAAVRQKKKKKKGRKRITKQIAHRSAHAHECTKLALAGRASRGSE